MDDLRRRIEDWTLGPVFPPLAALVAFILAAAAALFSLELRAATRAFLLQLTAFDPARPHVWTIAFWTTLATLAATVYVRYRAETWQRGEHARKMLQAVHRSPNPNVFLDYPRIFRQAEASVHALAAAAGEPADRHAAALASIHAVLARVVELARYFAQAPESRLRASVFLIARPDPVASEPYPAALLEKLRFFDRARHRLDGLRALLYLPAELAPRRDRPAPGEIRLALPVPHRAETAQGHRLALPGAPYSLLTGEPCIYEDTRSMVAEGCTDLEKAVRDEIERFFAKGGDGSDIRSSVTIRIGHDADPVGILELVSDHTHVLGHEPEYYVTFFALAEPLVRLLAAPVAAYEAAGRDLGVLPAAPLAPAGAGEAVGARAVPAD